MNVVIKIVMRFVTQIVTITSVEVKTIYFQRSELICVMTLHKQPKEKNDIIGIIKIKIF